MPSVVSDSVTPWTVAGQAPLSVGFLRREYGSGLPFPSPGDLPDPRVEARSPALASGFFTPEPPGKALSPSSPSVPRPCLRPDPLCSPLLFLLRTGPWGLGLQEGNRQCSASEEDSGGPGLFPEARRASPGRTLNAEQSGWGQRLLTEGSGTDGVESVIFHIQPK